MNEADVIRETPEPRTRQSLARDLRHLGLEAGTTVLVHSSLRSLGWVSGGAVAVVQALMEVITAEGTLVMPTHSGDLSDPAGWKNPPVPQSWWTIIRQTMPAFDPRTTPARGMGRIVEVFRTWPDVLRSDHPATSFAAWGKQAAFVTVNHIPDNEMGDSSPLGRLYDLDGWVLLMGVGYDSNTSFHLAEYRLPGAKPIRPSAPIIENGQRVWKAYDDIDLDDSTFEQMGADFEAAGHVSTGNVGSAEARFFTQRRAVDFAVQRLQAHRS